MDIVVTHDTADFDALASAVAAVKLYPNAHIALAKRFGRDVKSFLSLHKDRFPAVAADGIDAKSVRRVIVVDVRRASRLGHVSALRDRILARDGDLEVHVWDHHGAATDDIPAHFERVERVGSATTLLIEEIKRRAIDVDPVEATLFALGIHVDTGSLRYAATTARDASALAWVLERGARLGVINRYLDPPFTDGQRRALAAVLAAIRVERVSGARVGIANVSEGSGVDGLDEVTTEALALENVHALVAAFGLKGDKVQIVARSRYAWIDVGNALRAIGGGGHATAAAATVRDGHGDGALATVVGALRAQAPRPARARDLMSSPVHAVSPDMLVSTLRDSLATWGHTGAPVMKAEHLVGIISRRDVESALTQGRQSDRVAEHMSAPVQTVDEEATLEEALARMVASDVGRLPVMRSDRMIGILTRSDVLDALYGDAP